MRRSIILLGAFALFLVIGSAKVRSQEEAVSQDKIPKAVMDALLARFPKARIDKCVKEKEGDDVIYDIEFKQEGRNCEADIKENGTFLNYEKAIAARELPKAVSDAIAKRYPKATMNEIMEETEVKGKDETLSAYEVVLMTADKKEVEVRVSPDGKILEDTGAK
jgi:Putative beta-lactamase-inhibitor-like, PepSY-like